MSSGPARRSARPGPPASAAAPAAGRAATPGFPAAPGPRSPGVPCGRPGSWLPWAPVPVCPFRPFWPPGSCPPGNPFCPPGKPFWPPWNRPPGKPPVPVWPFWAVWSGIAAAAPTAPTEAKPMASAAATAVLRPDHVGGVTAGAVDGAGRCADGGVTGSAGTMITLVGITVVRSVEVAIGLSLLCGRGTPRPSRGLLCRGCGPRIAHLSTRHRALTGFVQVHGRHFSDRAATLPLMTQQTAHTSGSDLRRLDGSPVRVLVVDDEENLTELLSHGPALRGLGRPLRRHRHGRRPRRPRVPARRGGPRHDAAGLRRHGGAAPDAGGQPRTSPCSSSPPATPWRTGSPG